LGVQTGSNRSARLLFTCKSATFCLEARWGIKEVIVPDTKRPVGEVGKMIDESIFKAYDIRGVYPDNLNEDVARDIGRAFVNHLDLSGSRVVVARDMRLSGEALEKAFIEGVTEAGADVLDLGLVSTDALYFAVGHLEEPGGAMITASHNPKQYNGFKLCREDAIALSGEQGIGQIRDLIVSGKLPEPAEYTGSVEESDIAGDYAEHCLTFINTEGLRPLKIVVDAGNGMAGKMLPPIFEMLPFEYVPMYFKLDGSFPNHPPNPIEPENMKELQERVVAEGADFGAAFDGDADRVFVVDEMGETISGDLLAALVAKNVLEKEPGATILYSAVCSKAFPELVEREGGRAIRTKAGHSIIKPQMRENDAAFGGEHSGHFYFRDNYFADSGIIAMLTVAELAARQEGPLSELLAPIDPYVRSGEINSQVEDQATTLEKVEEHYSERDDPKIDHLDGLTVDFGDWWFNLRPSNTEPLLRLNVEASDRETIERERDELLDLIRS
jgi:phosphomannomutase